METSLDAKASRQWRRTPPLQRRRLLELAKRLEADPFLGSQIEKSRFPRPLAREQNLWRLPLPEGWRALYTVEGMGDRTTRTVVLWIGTHKEYDRLFGYATS